MLTTQTTTRKAPAQAGAGEPPAAALATACGQPGPSAASLLDAFERESVIFNLNASLRVYSRAHFFEWTQGLLQNLIRHDLLLCARRRIGATSLHADAFGTFGEEPALFADAFARDTAFAPLLMQGWENNRYEPVYAQVGGAGGLFERQLQRLDAKVVYAHGTHDSAGELQSFFLFAGKDEEQSTRAGLVLSLVVPFLHTAWMRIQVSRQMESSDAAAPRKKVLTDRQTEILNWVYLGKSNIEIGMILNVSPLTIKNHIQKILRKLDVQNRTQAIAKGVELRLVGR